MRVGVTGALFLLALAACQALPTPASKSLLEDADQNTNIEDAGTEKDRSKKSASFCVEIRPSSDKVHHGQAAQMVVEPQTLNLIQSAPQTVAQQTFSVVPAAQQLAQTVSVVPQQAQTYSFVPAPQAVPQTASSLILPAQQPVQPLHTLHIMQPAVQPCAQAAVNFVQPQPVPQPAPTLNIIQPAPQPAPEPEPVPEPKPEKIIEVVKPEPEQPKPTQVVNIIQPAPEPATETLNVLPMQPACEEQVVMKPVVLMSEPEPRPKPILFVSEPEPRPMATVVQVPTVSHQCRHQQHAMLTECNCHPKNVAVMRSSDSGLGHMHALAMKERSMGPLFRSQQRMDSRAMQPLMISGAGSGKGPMMILNRAIRSEEEAKKE